jgi:hypothetical protein
MQTVGRLVNEFTTVALALGDALYLVQAYKI